MAISGNQWQSPEAEQLEEHLEGEEERDDETDGLELRRIPVGRGEREFRQGERAVLSTGMCGEGGGSDEFGLGRLLLAHARVWHAHQDHVDL
jgi:hypothetical protein